MRPATRDAGFTLLEVLVAISVSAVLVSLVYGTIRVGQQSWESGQARIDESETGRIGWQFVHSALNRARLTDDPATRESDALFNGTGNGLRFVADMPAWLGLGGLYVVVLQSEERDGRRQLVLERTLFSEFRQPNTRNHPHRAVLVEDLENIDLRYFGTTDPRADPAWHGSWNKRDALPLLIELQVRPNGQAAWPLLVARPEFGGNRTTGGNMLEAAR